MDLSSATIITRPAIEKDRNFIVSTWLQGNYYGNQYFRQMIPDLYFEEYAKHINKILNSATAEIDVACDENNPTWIVGFIVFDGDLLHWCYTKKDYRGQGVLTLLCKGKNFKTVTTTTKIGRAITQNKGLIFNPMKE